ncbi:digalactosyldiacylglycerol synthase 2, chloroplastic isoform X2 [Brachypodium distachyon]|nr:digalactosyldiacylglycerol synthase 2, chloroplastic isoform X2 [Brachypodium distachyon]PNT77880.1 hypothetical protein BRADI_1g69930v3 [Brachypodium distachyon]|eukprot:XP_014753086.1 digalactosyldiacylglycerol synthase 2, chloroplastic isoform X2 [Brachypodium distachyon]
MSSTRRHFAIFTTASLPWMTGTSINPLFRAAYLAKDGDRDVTLVIPWLSLRDQELVYPNKIVFDSLLEHEGYVRRWIEERIDFKPSFGIKFYPGKIIRLSGATQDLPKSVICNVHGVNPKFLEVGKLKLKQLQTGEAAFTKGAYYIGKMVWSKGYRELLDLLSKYQTRLGGLEVDLYGSGEDSDEVRESAERLNLAVKVHPGRDHADPLFHDYKVFINPSTTDVVCTTSAEALAMGKIVICANHPSNEFFKQFPNCRIYNNDEEFVQVTLNALAEQPAPLTDMQMYDLSWEAATDRFMQAAEINLSVAEPRIHQASRAYFPTFLRTRKLTQSLEDASVYLHQALSGLEVTRCAFGAVPKTLQPDEQLRKDLGLASPTKRKRLKLKLMT